MSSKSANSSKGLLVIFSAPSGCGKTSIIDRLLKRHPDWVRSVSATTRPARTEEKEGEDYFFINRVQFKEMEKQGHFLETAKVHGEFYGTPKDHVLNLYEKGKTVILAIDVQGMAQLKQILGAPYRMITFFVLPPSLKALRERLEGRKTESAAQIEKRLKIAEEEIKQAELYDHTVVNQSLEQTVLEADELISQFQKERGK